MLGEEESAFWFYGRLHPAGRVPPFQAEEVVVEEGVRLEVIWDGIGVWSLPKSGGFRQPGEATELFGLVVAAYALLMRSTFTVSSDGWVEAKKASLDGSVLGFQAQQMNSSDQVKRDSEESVALRAACVTAIALRSHPNYRVAIRDIYSALGATGSDAFFFAYRAVESVARAATDALDLCGADWEAFHRRVGIEPEDGKAKLRPLSEARNALAHGNVDADVVNEAERARRRLIDLARWFVIAAVEAEPGVTTPDLSSYRPEI